MFVTADSQPRGWKSFLLSWFAGFLRKHLPAYQFCFCRVHARVGLGFVLRKTISGEKFAAPLCNWLLQFSPPLPRLSLFSGGMAQLPEAIVYALFLLATVFIGGLTGFQFSQSSQIQRGDFAETSGKTYSFDLIGSAFRRIGSEYFSWFRNWESSGLLFALAVINVVLGILANFKENLIEN